MVPRRRAQVAGESLGQQRLSVGDQCRPRRYSRRAARQSLGGIEGCPSSSRRSKPFYERRKREPQIHEGGYLQGQQRSRLPEDRKPAHLAQRVCERWEGHEFVAEYVDREPVTTGRRECKGFDRMFADAAERRFDVLLFWALDRFSREGIRKTIAYLQRLCG